MLLFIFNRVPIFPDREVYVTTTLSTNSKVKSDASKKKEKGKEKKTIHSGWYVVVGQRSDPMRRLLDNQSVFVFFLCTQLSPQPDGIIGKSPDSTRVPVLILHLLER